MFSALIECLSLYWIRMDMAARDVFAFAGKQLITVLDGEVKWGAPTPGSLERVLESAVRHNCVLHARFLLVRGADAGAGNGVLLAMACAAGRPDMAQLLLDHGASAVAMSVRDPIFAPRSNDIAIRAMLEAYRGLCPVDADSVA